MAVSNWAVVERSDFADGTHREVRMSPTGLVLVEDRLYDGTFRATRITVDGRVLQEFGNTSTEAWRKTQRAANA